MTVDLRTAENLHRLLTVPKIGPVTALRIARHFPTWEEAVEASRTHNFVLPDELPEVPDTPPGITRVGFWDENYPFWLRSLTDPPPVIWYRGTFPTENTVAVVGTRHPTGFGTAAATAAATSAIEHGWLIVSGLAVGCDTIAHTVSVEANRPTWAVLGGPVTDQAIAEHPNTELAWRILEASGGLISETPPEATTEPWRLACRNRLIVAFAKAVIPAQFTLTSGTMYAVVAAVRERRHLAVPVPTGKWADEPESEGNLAVTDPAGCDPDRVPAVNSAQLRRLFSARRPVADTVLVGRNALPGLWAELTETALVAPAPLF